MPRGNISRIQILNSVLRDNLRHNVDDEHFLHIFADFAKLIHTSVKLHEHADALLEDAEDEINYIEELLGLSFVLLQAKIRRVSEAAAKASPLKPSDARALGRPYKNTGKSLAELIWAVGNYYKHRDEWDREVWKVKKADEQENNTLRQSRKTRSIIEQLGVERRSACNMRKAYDFFDIDWASNCTPLASRVQEWATAVYEKCAKP
jgi:hypothetical protein